MTPEATGRPGYHPALMLNLFSDAFVAIDGSKFRAVNNRNKNFSKAKIKARLQQIDASIERYLGETARADRREGEGTKTKTERLENKIAALKEEIQTIKKLEVRMLATPDQQISLTDSDARAMATAGRGKANVGYNVQVAVDTTRWLIVAISMASRFWLARKLALLPMYPRPKPPTTRPGGYLVSGISSTSPGMTSMNALQVRGCHIDAQRRIKVRLSSVTGHRPAQAVR